MHEGVPGGAGRCLGAPQVEGAEWERPTHCDVLQHGCEKPVLWVCREGNGDNVSDEVFPEKKDMDGQVLTRLYLKSHEILRHTANHEA